MASKSIRRYDVQAKVSLIISLLGCVGFAGLIAIMIRQYRFDERLFIYARDGMVQPVFLLGTAITALLGAIGAAIGFSSAGQRRNPMQRRSWVAFFVGTAVVAGAIISLALFWSLSLRLK
ncbi:MAG: hypothetical protein GY842_14830 [bacterium]|nr:hypothetical protein [bacterium]